MYTFIILMLFVELASAAPPTSVPTYLDQRQNGELNVHVNLKDLHIIALVGDGEHYTDYDYNYDYAEMTIKPLNSTSTTENSLSGTNSSALPEKPLNSSSLIAEDVVLITPAPINKDCEDNDSTNVTVANATVLTANEKSVQTTIGYVDTTVTSSTQKAEIAVTNRTISKLETSTVVDSKTECRKGFHRNKHGECEVKPKNTAINTLKKLVELSQKLKLRHVD